jgi:PP-loop superfamily ATP-utilizing enzyme
LSRTAKREKFKRVHKADEACRTLAAGMHREKPQTTARAEIERDELQFFVHYH